MHRSVKNALPPLALLLGPLSVARAAPPSPPLAARLATVKQSLPGLDLRASAPPPADESVHEYFRHYGLTVDGAQHLFGAFRCAGHELAAHVFRPERPVRGTVVLVHGYNDHSGVWRHVIADLVGQGCAVATYDQPGHGLSSGPRGEIDDFDQYVAVLDEFLRICRADLPGPFHLVAHSLGGAVAADRLLRAEQAALDRVVLLAPLFRSAHWNLSGFGRAVAGVAVKSVPRVFRNNSSDPAFIEFVKADPLQPRRVPLAWFAALRKWNKRISRRPPSDKPLTIIQGGADVIVDWQRNLGFFREKFPHAHVALIPDAGHQLANESAPIRAQVLELIRNSLASPAPARAAERRPTTKSTKGAKDGV